MERLVQGVDALSEAAVQDQETMVRGRTHAPRVDASIAYAPTDCRPPRMMVDSSRMLTTSSSIAAKQEHRASTMHRKFWCWIKWSTRTVINQNGGICFLC
jgi:hypothetical protein